MDVALLGNVGTAMVFALTAYLVLANLFIGIFEGIVVAWRARPVMLCIVAMVVANYISAFVGYAMLQSAVNAVLDATLIEPLHHLDAIRWLPIVGALALSIVIEGLILVGTLKLLARRGGESRTKSSKALLRRLVIANCVTYAALVPLYFFASGVPSDTGFVVVEGRSALARVSSLPEVDMYFMRHSANSDAVEVVVVPLRGGTTERVIVDAVPGGADEQDRLALIDSELGIATLVVLESQKAPRPGDLARIEAFAASPYVAPHDYFIDAGRLVGMPIQPVIGAESHAPAHRRTLRRDPYGSVLEHREVDREIRIDLPLFRDAFSGVIDLGDRFALASVGNRIVLIDFEAKQMAILTEGFGPAVVVQSTHKATAPDPSDDQ